MAGNDNLSDSAWPFLARYVRRRGLAHGAILGSVVVAVGCSVGTQYGIKMLVDALSAGRTAVDGVWFAFGILVTLVAGDNLMWRLAGWIASYTFVAVTGDVRSDLFRHLTGHAPSFFQDRMPGTLAGRISATATAVFMVESMMIWNVLPPLMATLGAIALLSTVSVGMTAGLVVFAAALAWGLFRLAMAGRPLHRAFADRAAAVDGETVDVVSNMALVRAFGGLRREHRRFDEVVGRELKARRHSLLYLERLRFLHAGVTIVSTIGLLAWAILLWRRGQSTTGDVVLVSTLGFTILHATRDLAVAFVDMTQHLARLSEAVATIMTPHTLADLPKAQRLHEGKGRVTLEGVSFAYPGGVRVFEQFDLEVPAGQRVGLVGRSGGGKSTLLALLQRFHDPERGRITIDGQDIARITQESLRNAISVVPQDVSLFHRTIRENIRYGRADASDDAVRAAADAALCSDFIAGLPNGMETIVGDRGVKLSGGQRQRIAIARAFLKDAPILLLDEATSALDVESENAIRMALDRLMRGRTVIAIAHRISTLRAFDRIVVMEHGRVIEDGPPDRLMGTDGPYRALVEGELERLARVAG
jgi:ATP-binding cassette subfamily B protein